MNVVNSELPPSRKAPQIVYRITSPQLVRDECIIRAICQLTVAGEIGLNIRSIAVVSEFVRRSIARPAVAGEGLVADIAAAVVGSEHLRLGVGVGGV